MLITHNDVVYVSRINKIFEKKFWSTLHLSLSHSPVWRIPIYLFKHDDYQWRLYSYDCCGLYNNLHFCTAITTWTTLFHDGHDVDTIFKLYTIHFNLFHLWFYCDRVYNYFLMLRRTIINFSKSVVQSYYIN